MPASSADEESRAPDGEAVSTAERGALPTKDLLQKQLQRMLQQGKRLASPAPPASPPGAHVLLCFFAAISSQPQPVLVADAASTASGATTEPPAASSSSSTPPTPHSPHNVNTTVPMHTSGGDAISSAPLPEKDGRSPQVVAPAENNALSMLLDLCGAKTV
jgi:hypothetical protein